MRLKENKRLILKILVAVAFSFIWLLIALGRVTRPITLRIDTDCVMGLAATFQQGSISGRDFHYTYGVVAQALAWAGASLNGSAFDGFRLSVLAWYATAALLWGAIVLLIEDIGPLYITFLYVASIALDLLGWFPSSDVASFRVLLVIVAVMAAGKSLASPTATGRRTWAVMAGFLCIVGQLTTIELGPYALGAGMLLCLGYAARAHYDPEAKFRPPIETLALLAGVYVVGNLAIDSYFWLTGSHYSFWDYQRYAAEIIRGYVYGSPWIWQYGRWRSVGLAVVIVYTFAAVWGYRNRMNPSDRAVMFGVAIASLFCLKTALVRSEGSHIKAAMTPVALALLALGRWILPELKLPGLSWKGASVWVAMVTILFFSWPGEVAPVTDLIAGVKSLGSGGLYALVHSRTEPASVLPLSIVSALQGAEVPGAVPKPLLPFPFENDLAPLLRRRLVAPVLQSFAANTIPLQQYYVASLQRESPNDLDVAYSADRTGWWPVDGIQTISRDPIIFEYFYRNFELRQHAGPLSVLRAREAGRTVTFDDLAFQLADQRGQRSDIHLPASTRCGLLQLDIQVAYPVDAQFLKPSPIGVLVLNNNVPIFSGALIALDVRKPFNTFLSMVPQEQFFKVFGDGSLPAPEWNRIILAPASPDPMFVPPRLLHVLHLSCVDGRRFVP